MKPAIRVDNLSKHYRIGPSQARPYRTLRESLVDTACVPVRALRRAFGYRSVREPQQSTDFWALKDVSFEVKPGEVVGIIGRNGAGKSTLLKILSRITEPTKGRIEVRGRMGSLLEVGTGFHPELTGRENIYMNGSILGMSSREIHNKFDQIVEFSEIEQFLDTPVKRYSSGMYVRLAFSVAAHLEPEILVVDEVLAVGDIAFQRKCLGRMGEIGRSGRTDLFVSHNMGAIEALCDSAILLETGKIKASGHVHNVTLEYYRNLENQTNKGFVNLESTLRDSGLAPIIHHASLLDEQDHPTNYLPLGGRFRLRIGLFSQSTLDQPTVGVAIDDDKQQRYLTIQSPLSFCAINQLKGYCEVDCDISAFPLAPGDFSITLGIASKGTQVDYLRHVLGFTVVNSDAFGEGRGFHRGICVAPSTWSLRVKENRSSTCLVNY